MDQECRERNPAKMSHYDIDIHCKKCNRYLYSYRDGNPTYRECLPGEGCNKMKTPEELARNIEKEFKEKGEDVTNETIIKENGEKSKEWASENGEHKTVAVDFDGVISAYNGWKGEGVFGKPIDLQRMISELLYLHHQGWKIIIWTTRNEQADVADWLGRHIIPYDAINHNPWAPKNIVNSRKIVADVYIDDRAIPFDGSWESMASKVQLLFTKRREREQQPEAQEETAADVKLPKVEESAEFFKGDKETMEEILGITSEFQYLQGEEKKWVGDVINTNSPDEILNLAADFFRKKNNSAHYNNGFKQFGKIMESIYPEGFHLESQEDWNLIGVLSQIISKISRLKYSTKATEGDFEKHVDNGFDLTVYSSMLTNIISELEKK
jgi:hypothetical protein